MEKALKRKGITREYLWQKYISEHPDGYRLSMFKEHYSRWRKQSTGVMHLDHKAGDKMIIRIIPASMIFFFIFYSQYFVNL
jgi:transposase